jgi:hypothetical protein
LEKRVGPGLHIHKSIDAMPPGLTPVAKEVQEIEETSGIDAFIEWRAEPLI